MSEQDCQCARCGSSMYDEECDACSGSCVVGHECGEDCCSCADPIDNVLCDECNGHGRHYYCLSSPEWCQANPRPGRESTERHTVEWFEIGATP